MNSSLGPPLVLLGVGLTVLGVLVWSGAFGWLGKLPGDIRFVRGGVRFYFPLVSMLLVSLLLSGIAHLLRRFF